MDEDILGWLRRRWAWWLTILLVVLLYAAIITSGAIWGDGTGGGATEEGCIPRLPTSC